MICKIQYCNWIISSFDKSPTVTKIGLAIAILFWMTPIIAQDVESLKENVTNKIESVKDSLLSNKMSISGQANANMVYTLLRAKIPEFDYYFNINLQATYKGVKLPFQYSFSNGRSIYRFNGPSFRTPSFKLFGLSPEYKGFKIHIGNRIMDFSKYTYQNVRFQGFGVQTPEKGIYLKAFAGTLKLIEPADLIYRSEIEPDYKRKSWGTLVGFTNKKLHIKGIVFSANDQIDLMDQIDTSKAPPKENTVISYSLQYKPIENILIKAEQSLSALTDNAFSDRVNILTPQSTKNMLGLFEKKETSHYYDSRYFELQYQIHEQEISYIHEAVDKNYRSLGSLYYDQNFIEHKLKVAGHIKEKLNYSVTGGFREIKDKKDSSLKDSKIVIQTMLTYLWNKHFTSFGSFNNFKTVQQDYFRGLNSSAIDSISLSQVNKALSIGSNYIGPGKYPMNLSLIASLQSSNSIDDEIVQSTNSQSKLLSLAYSKKLEKDNVNFTMSYISSKAVAYMNTTLTGSVLYGRDLGEKFKISNIFQYQSVSFTEKHVNQITLRGTLEYKYDSKKTVILDMGLDFDNANQGFSLSRFLTEIDISIKF